MHRNIDENLMQSNIRYPEAVVDINFQTVRHIEATTHHNIFLQTQNWQNESLQKIITEEHIAASWTQLFPERHPNNSVPQLTSSLI